MHISPANPQNKRKHFRVWCEFSHQKRKTARGPKVADRYLLGLHADETLDRTNALWPIWDFTLRGHDAAVGSEADLRS